MRVAVLVVACALAPAANARPGKVIRIERHAHRFSGEPRLCAVMPDQLVAYCYGKAPEHGATMAVMDQTHVLGVLAVEKSEPLSQCRGAGNTLCTAALRNDSGLALAVPDSSVAGLLDVTVDPRHAKLVKVDEVPGDRPGAPEQVSAFDLDGDSKADLEFITFACDETGNPVTGTGAQDQCIELWAATGRTYERLRTDRIGRNCY